MNDCTCTVVDPLDLDKDIEDPNCPLHGRGSWVLCRDAEGDVTLCADGAEDPEDGAPFVRWVNLTWSEAKAARDAFLYGGE